MNGILLRIIVIVGGIAFTALTFNFWGDFSIAMNRYLDVVAKDDKPSPPPQQKGVVTMTIIQPATPYIGLCNPKHPCEPPKCNKQHPCPK